MLSLVLACWLRTQHAVLHTIFCDAAITVVNTPFCVELLFKWEAVGLIELFTRSKNYHSFSDLGDSLMTAKPLQMGGPASREALHTVLAHLRSQHLNTHGLVMERMSRHFHHVKKTNLLFLSTIGHLQRTVGKTHEAFFDTCAFSFIPPSSAQVQLSTSIGQACLLAGEQLCGDSVERLQSFPDEYGKAAKRQHSAWLKNTEQNTPKRKKRTRRSCSEHTLSSHPASQNLGHKYNP